MRIPYLIGAPIMDMETCRNHPETDAGHQCRVCNSHCCGECIHEGTGICHGCLYKGVVILVVIMVIISYTVWFGLF